MILKDVTPKDIENIQEKIGRTRGGGHYCVKLFKGSEFVKSEYFELDEISFPLPKSTLENNLQVSQLQQVSPDSQFLKDITLALITNRPVGGGEKNSFQEKLLETLLLDRLKEKPQGDSMQLFNTIMTAAEKISEKMGDKTENWISAVKEFAPQAFDTVNKLIDKSGQSAPIPAPLQIENNPQQQIEEPKKPEVQPVGLFSNLKLMKLWNNKFIRNYLFKLISWAEEDENPETLYLRLMNDPNLLPLYEELKNKTNLEVKEILLGISEIKESLTPGVFQWFEEYMAYVRGEAKIEDTDGDGLGSNGNGKVDKGLHIARKK